MTFTSFETILYQHLTPFFERQGFVLLPDKKQYRRTTSTGFQTVMLLFGLYNDETILDVTLGCRSEQIEQIAQQFLRNQVMSHQDAITLTVSINQFSDFQFVRFRIHNGEELVDACWKIEQFFQTSGFAFLTSSCTLPVLDRLLNENPAHPCRYVYNQLHRYYKGLIAAHLTRNAQFNNLIERYRNLLGKQTQNPYEQIQFERLIAYLHHYYPN
ncbi:hypothetical protein [Spirosoma fluviale]|uniref:DUF4304 domain-containing protein n=1 Tax=Spirosoma fluviale TaxID=1597977 RepID=A0A286FF35_9BACT|nr:hypothetical protein [Spirosoma fluviale]SOD81830.1 hypothetical protein SAMN06269250_1928 [Spirosoma fluviale]